MDSLDKIFRAYDVRGIYPGEINEEMAYKIAKVSAKILAASKNKKLVVARDNRPSSEKLFEAVIKGINDFGVNVINIGLSATPVFYFAVNEFNADGGIMVTASHNSENYNGFKIVKEKATPIGSKGLKKIKKLFKRQISDSKEKGKIEIKEITKDYIKSILKLGKKNFNPSDLTNFSSRLNFTVDFDNDKDRIFFIDENNRKIDPDLISAILIHYCFKNAGKILYTVANSRIVREEAINSGNKTILSKIGHSFIKEKMAKKNIVFGCEASGHYYFKETGYYTEAPLLVLMRIIEIMQETKKSLLALVEQFNKYRLERIEFEIADVEKFKLQFKNIKKEYKKFAKISFLDGITAEAEDWWFNLRTSNTEPIARLTIEANTKELLEKQKEKLLKLTIQK